MTLISIPSTVTWQQLFQIVNATKNTLIQRVVTRRRRVLIRRKGLCAHDTLGLTRQRPRYPTKLLSRNRRGLPQVPSYPVIVQSPYVRYELVSLRYSIWVESFSMHQLDETRNSGSGTALRHSYENPYLLRPLFFRLR